MKRNLLLILTIFISFTAVCQEELFVNQNGISFSYLQTINLEEEANFATGISAVINKNIVLSAAFSQADGKPYPIAGVGFYTPGDTVTNPIRFMVGVSYARLENLQIGIVTAGVVQTFFPKSNFRFSVSANYSGQVVLSSNGTSYSLAGFNYTQGIFAKGLFYPCLAFGANYDFKNEEIYYSGMIGFNAVITSRKKSYPKFK